MWSSLSDEALLAGLAAGEPEAAAAFVRRFQSRVYGLVFAILGDRARTEEVAQETFVRAWRHAASYDSRRGRVLTWLLAIARNLAIDVARLKRVEPMEPEVVERRLERVDAGAGPGDQAVAPDERAWLRRAVAELPPEQRRALFQAAYLGRTAREISELDRVPLGTVKSRIRAAMLKLHDSLEGSHDV
ncbi:MAG TPA: sigma-70 family RNA polymerase sigma factor [Solirubrobacterales bacterium]|jgi:RNA polymerase sigma-70 factor (ECF subfamily)|nr:sigma-70 family RNA polymerase sigma factor [Solirubrobacterales bacterium]